MLQMDLDLEADLGIDTVKQAEMFAAIRAAWDIAERHHLHKPVMIGEIQSDGQFSVVWQTEAPIRAQPWSPYIPGNDKKPDYAVKSN